MGPTRQDDQTPNAAWRQLVHRVIFEADTFWGKVFDLALIALIVLSIVSVILESVPSIERRYGDILRAAEWVFTWLFTVEYVLRLSSVRRPAAYATSFFGVVDLIAIVPTYLSLFVAGTQVLAVVRVLRVLRIFRILRLARYVGEANFLMRALWRARRKIFVFLCAVLSLLMIVGSLMYAIEGAESGFTSIPIGIYWAVVTLTTVGYGDISPKTEVGQFLASAVMILGYAIIAIPTGIVTLELTGQGGTVTTRACPGCGREGHDEDARFCKHCGHVMDSAEGPDGTAVR